MVKDKSDRKQVNTYLGPEVYADFKALLVPRYGVSASSTIEQVLAEAIRRVKNNNTKEQELHAIKEGVIALGETLAALAKQMDRITYQNTMLLAVLWQIGKPADGRIQISADDLQQVWDTVTEFIGRQE